MPRGPRRFLVLLLVALVAALVWWALGRRDVVKPALPTVSQAVLLPTTKSGGVSEIALPGDARTEAAATPQGLNAADLYKEAMAIYDALSENEKEWLRKPVREMPPDEADALFAKVETILSLLQQAADEAAYCDWALGEYKYNSPMPHIFKAMNVGQAAVWAANYLFGKEDQQAAIDALLNARKLGESVSGITIGHLVQSALEGFVAKSFAGSAHAFSNEQYRAVIDETGSRAEVLADYFHLSMLNEANFMKRSFDELSKLPKEELNGVLGIIPDGKPENARLSGIFENPEELRREVEYLVKTTEEFALHGLSDDKTFSEWKSKVERDFANYPLAGMALKSLLLTRDRLRQTQAMQGMLLAGMALMQDDDAAFQATLDPATGKPFVVVETENGFELQSGYVSKNKPLSLAFPQTSGSQKKP